MNISFDLFYQIVNLFELLILVNYFQGLFKTHLKSSILDV